MEFPRIALFITSLGAATTVAQAEEYTFDTYNGGAQGLKPWFIYTQVDATLCPYPDHVPGWSLDNRTYAGERIGTQQLIGMKRAWGCNKVNAIWDFALYDEAADFTGTLELSYLYHPLAGSYKGFDNFEITVTYNSGLEDIIFLNQQTHDTGEFYTIGQYENIEKVTFTADMTATDYSASVNGYPTIDGIKLTRVAGEPPTPDPDVCWADGNRLEAPEIPNIVTSHTVSNVIQDQHQSHLHYYVDVIGDVNNDGVTDRIVGNGSKVWVEFMHADGTHTDGSEINLGHKSLKRASDINGDGIPDIVAGYPHHNGVTSQTGSISFVALNRDGTEKQRYLVSNYQNGGLQAPLNDYSLFGMDVEPYADTDNDGNFELFAVTAPGYEPDGINSKGGVFIVDVSNPANVTETWVRHNSSIALREISVVPNGANRPFIFASTLEQPQPYSEALYMMAIAPDYASATLSENNLRHIGDLFPEAGNQYGIGADLAVLGDIDDDGRVEIAVPAMVGFPYYNNNREAGSLLILDVNNNGMLSRDGTHDLIALTSGQHGFPEILDSNSNFSFTTGVFYDLVVNSLVLTTGGKGAVYTIFLGQ